MKERVVEVEIRLSLPDSLAKEAEERGLLEPSALEKLLREAVRSHHVDRLFAAADRLSALSLPPMTDDELNEEIQAVRATRRTLHADSR